MNVIAHASALALSAVILSAPASATSLIGQSATAVLTSGSDAVTVVGQFTSAQVVGAGTEFTGSFTDVVGGSWQVLVDIQATGFTVNFTALAGSGNLLSVNGNNLVRIDLSGLTGLRTIALESHSCLPVGFPCNVGGTGPQVREMGSDATSAFVGFRAVRNSDTYSFSLVDAVPEPASWAMMIAGFGLAGAAIRRRPARALAAA